MSVTKIDRPATADEALLWLWNRSRQGMNMAELEWFGKLSDQAEVELRSIADVLSDAGCRTGLTGAGGIDEEALAGILFTAANTARNAAAMVFIAGEAEHVQKNFDRYRPERVSATRKAGGKQ